MHQQQITEYLTTHDTATMTDLATHCRGKVADIQDDIDTLEAHGVIERTDDRANPDTRRSWRLVPHTITSDTPRGQTPHDVATPPRQASTLTIDVAGQHGTIELHGRGEVTIGHVWLEVDGEPGEPRRWLHLTADGQQRLEVEPVEPESPEQLDARLRARLREGWSQPEGVATSQRPGGVDPGLVLADPTSLPPGRIEIGPPYSRRRVTIDSVAGIRVEPDGGGATFHIRPDADSGHYDPDPEVCREDPFVAALGAHLEDPAVAYDVALWLLGVGNDALREWLAL